MHRWQSHHEPDPIIIPIVIAPSAIDLAIYDAAVAAALVALHFRFELVDTQLAKGTGVLFFCQGGKHQSAAVAAAYIARCTPMSPDAIMESVHQDTHTQRGDGSAAAFHDVGLHPLRPLVRAAAVLARGPPLPE